jgi:hypothetical protein
MLLEVSELPQGEWTIIGELAWRSGFFGGKKGGMNKRTRKAGGFIAWRSLKLASPHRGLWLEVIPYASKEDAEMAVPLQVEASQENHRVKVTLRESRVLDNYVIREADTSWVCERDTTTLKGPNVSRYVVGNVERFVFMLAATAYGDGWPLDEVALMASTQANKIRGVLTVAPPNL